MHRQERQKIALNRLQIAVVDSGMAHRSIGSLQSLFFIYDPLTELSLGYQSLVS
jgi:hypothetical protein